MRDGKNTDMHGRARTHTDLRFWLRGMIVALALVCGVAWGDTELGGTKLWFGPSNDILFAWNATDGRIECRAGDDTLLWYTPVSGGGITATGDISVSKSSETTAAVKITTSAGTSRFSINSGGLLVITTPGTETGLYASSTALYIQRILRPDTNNSRDLGTSTVGWRNLYLSGDASIGGGDIFGPAGDGTLNTSSEGSLTFMIDSDNDGTASVFSVRANGSGTSLVRVSEAGALTATGAISGASVAATGAITAASVTTTDDVTVGDDLTVAGRAVLGGGTFTAGDTTPSVAGGNVFQTATSGSAVSISSLDDGTARQPVIIVGRASPATSVLDTGNINLAGSGGLTLGGGDTLTLIYNGTIWCEVSRTDN